MAISKRARVWIIVLSIPIVLVIGAVIAAKLYFTSDRLKAMIVPRIAEATNRNVMLKDISLSVFPSIGVTAESLSIANPTKGGFESPAFISLARLDVNVKLFPLIGGNIEVSKVILDRPHIYLEVTKGGIKNSRMKTVAQAAADTTTPSGTSVGKLLVNDFEIRSGTIESIDKRLDSRYTIGELDQTATIRSTNNGRVLVIEGESNIGKFSYGTVSSWYVSNQPITATEQLTYNLTKDVLSFDKVDAKLKDLPLTVSGRISDLQEETIVMDLTVTAPQAQMTQLLSLVPPEMLKAAKGLQSSGDVKLTATIKGPSSDQMNPAVNAQFTVARGRIQYEGLPKAITSVNVNGVFEQPSAPVGRKDLGRLAIEKFTATVGSNTITGKLSAQNFKDPTISATFNGTVNLAEVKDFYPLEEGTELAGLMKANLSLDGKAKVPQSIRADGKIEFQNVTIKSASSPNPLKNLSGTITFNNELIQSRQLAMNVGESDLNLSFAVRNYLGLVMEDAKKTAGKPSATITLTSRQLRTADLMASEKPEAEKTAAKKPTSQGGLLPGIDVDANVSIDKLITEEFTFNNAHGALAVSDGVINLKNFSVNAFDGTIQTKGTLDVRDSTRRPFDLDLNISNVESHALLPKFTSFGNYLFGKLSMTTKLRGDLNDTLGLNPQSLLGSGKVDVAGGRLAGMPLTQKLAGVTNIDELREVSFKEWTNSFSISGGRLNVKDLKVNAGTVDFLMEGSLGLEGSLDYDLTVKLPAAFSDRLKLPGVGSELLQFFKDKEGRINLTFDVTGTASDPALKLNTEAQETMARQALEQKKQELIEQGKKKAEEELKKKAEEGLKKLFKRP